MICAAAALQAQQQILLLTETFENATNSMVFNTALVGANTGPNNWVVNNQYNGQSIYTNTPPQDSIVSGTINGAPNSKYLHIRDAAQPNGAINANWDNNTASDRFAYIGQEFCTLGMTDVKFTFFWICEGDSTNGAYGELYARINGGAWQQVGQPKYYGQKKWKYEVVQNALFNNAENVQLGFRWINNASVVSSTISFGIDDIIAVGTYENTGPNAATVGISLVSPLTICQDNFLTIGYALSKPLCDGTYRIQLSDANGNFNNPFDGGVFNINAPDTAGFIGFQVPDNVSGTCFKVRINRVSPEPQIIGTASVCFSIVDCAESIFTLNAPVVTDNDTACVLSAIDVKFNSYGVFANNNRYIAQLSDTNGTFGNPYVLGQLPSSESFPAMPGNVSGLIPQNAPPGCGYYIRIVSTNPSTIGTTYGPFCITRCDELTNNHTDLKFCVQSGPNPQCDSFTIQPNYWDSTANYAPCNNWTVELRSMMDFSLVNSGSFGVFQDSVGGKFNICMPANRNLLPVPAGTYYMRIVSNCSNQAWNQTGSVIRITIGAPDPVPPIISTDLGDTVFCNIGLVNFYISPYNSPPSQYEWSSNVLNNGNAFIWPFNPLIVDFTGSNTGDFRFYVREINFGCFGAYSSAKDITIISTPNVNITGPKVVCLGDTVTYDVTYLKETYYDWDAPPGTTLLDEANSQVTVIFDTLGTYTLSNFSLNDCGSDSGSYSVDVITPYVIDAGVDQSFCTGDTLKLNANSNSISKVFETDTNSTPLQGRQGAMFNLIAHEDVVIDSFAVKFLPTPQLVQFEIYGKNGSYRTFEQDQSAWTYLDGYNNFPIGPANTMTVVPLWLNKSIAASDTFAFYLTTKNTTAINMAFGNGTGIQQGVVYESDGIIDFVQGAVNNYPFGAFIGPRVLNCRIYYSTKAGLHYMWNTGDTLPTLMQYPPVAGQYTVTVYDSSGCKARDSVMVSVNATPNIDAGPDTLLCKGIPYTIPAASNATNAEWQPQANLDNYNALNPVFDARDSVKYYLTVTDNNGCKNIDSVVLRVGGPEIYAGNDTAVCPTFETQLQVIASAGTILWQPATGLSDAASLTPMFSGEEAVTYNISVTDSNGCIAYDELRIEMAPCETYIKIPQAFTPNGDGMNDFFTVFGQYIDDYEIRIFNRWGEMVYQSTNVAELNNLGAGWDGTYKGKLQDVGTFVYYIYVKYSGGEKAEKKGNITLIR